jgi:CRP-like cAMP-binding protein
VKRLNVHDKTQSALQSVARKLQLLADLEPADIAEVMALPFRLQSVGSGHLLVREGTRPTECCFLVEGYACRHKVARSGKRQIVSFHIAGDILDLQHLLLETADHNVQTITLATVAWVDKQHMLELSRNRPMIAEALWKDSLVDGSVFREWVLNVGQRDAKARIAHMLCEFASRCEAVGLGGPERLLLPFTQEQIGDAVGLTNVHVNRTIAVMRRAGLIEVQRPYLRVHDWSALQKMAGFDPTYLHQAAA